MRAVIAQLAGTNAVVRDLHRPYLSRKLAWVIAHDRKLKELQDEVV